MVFDKEQVLRWLPHREPFLFIDTLDEIIPAPGKENPKIDKDILGLKIKASFFVKPELEILRGHFPGNPILPGVVQVEMMAQASSFCIIPLFEDPFARKMAMKLLSTDNSKFRKPVLPGMHLIIESECTRVRGHMFSYKANITSENEVVSETELLAWADFEDNL